MAGPAGVPPTGTGTPATATSGPAGDATAATAGAAAAPIAPTPAFVRPAPGEAPAPGARPTISVRGLWKIFGPAEQKIVGTPDETLSNADIRRKTGSNVAIRDVSFDVWPGEVFVVMGLSGSGKSTLVRCLTRLIEPTAGEVLLDGEDIRKADAKRLRELRRRRFAMVFQHFGLLPHRKVIDNVAYGLEIRGISKAERHARARETIELVGLVGFENRYPDQLSGGQQQRVGLARALAVDPEVMLFDEPFSALDPLIRRDMQNEVIRLHKEVGKTMVFITHDLAEALKLGDHIVIMRNGEIVQAGRPEDLVGAPADDYVADFVRDVPKSHVLTLRWIMREPRFDDPLTGPEFPPDTVIRTVIHQAAASERPLRVVEDGRLIGVVDRVQILTAIAGLEDEADADVAVTPVDDGRTLAAIAAADVAAESEAEQRALDAALASTPEATADGPGSGAG